MDQDATDEVRSTTTALVRAPIDVAFRVFAEQRWWPLATHHLAEPPGDEVVLEPFAGGRWYERSADGREQEWGTVLAWEPPHRILLTWQVSADWTYEPDPDRASEIEVRFIAAGPDETRVEYSHRHLERYGDGAARMRRAVGGSGGAAGAVAAYVHALGGRSRRERGGTPVFTAFMVNRYTSDVARTVAFYRDLLGFQPTFRYPAEGTPEHVELRLGSSTLAVSGHAAVEAMGLPTPTPGHEQELVLGCASVDAAVDRLRAAGAPILVEPFDHVAGHRRAYAADPDGAWLALVDAAAL